MERRNISQFFGQFLIFFFLRIRVADLFAYPRWQYIYSLNPSAAAAEKISLLGGAAKLDYSS